VFQRSGSRGSGTLEIKNAGATLQGRQYGQYAQSSGSGNVNMLIADTDTLAAMH